MVKQGFNAFLSSSLFPYLNIIETLWRFMKYIGIDYSAYLNGHNLLLYIQKIFDGYGRIYRIDFS